jgi:hypothetical protein
MTKLKVANSMFAMPSPGPVAVDGALHGENLSDDSGISTMRVDGICSGPPVLTEVMDIRRFGEFARPRSEERLKHLRICELADLVNGRIWHKKSLEPVLNENVSQEALRRVNYGRTEILMNSGKAR